jgi:hypothetical protein
VEFQFKGTPSRPWIHHFADAVYRLYQNSPLAMHKRRVARIEGQAAKVNRFFTSRITQCFSDHDDLGLLLSVVEGTGGKLKDLGQLI